MSFWSILVFLKYIARENGSKRDSEELRSCNVNGPIFISQRTLWQKKAQESHEVLVMSHFSINKMLKKR